MATRRTPSILNQFLGLNLDLSRQDLMPQYFVEATNVVISDNQINLRPGRVELAEDQEEPAKPLGIQTYNRPNNAGRTLIVVREDGIFQRIDS